MPSNAKKKNQPTIIGVPWNFVSFWNTSLDTETPRPLMPRSYLYASDVGGAFCDRYLAMNAVPYTNPPNFRSRRKFQVGDLFEWVVGMMFISGGIFKKKQIRVETELKKMLSVHGRLDFIVGGAFDYDTAKKRINDIKDSLQMLDIELPPFFFNAIDAFVDNYKGQILQECVYEAKSLSSFMIEKVQKSGALQHNIFQTFHYVYGNDEGINLGKIGYVCRDSLVMEEFDVLPSAETFKLYKSDIAQMTDYYNRGFDKKNPLKFLPPREKAILFEEGIWRFTKNFKIEYSKYLNLLYPQWETPEDFRNSCQSKIAAWSRAFKRYVLEGKEVKTKVKGEIKTTTISLTASNREKRDECIKEGFDWDKYVKAARKDGAFVDADETEEEN